jgi:hypothetical protein
LIRLNALLTHLYRLAFAVLLTHELDAVMQSEWRLLYVFKDLPDATASAWFIALHVPLVAGLLWLFENPSKVVHVASRSLLALFMLIHAGLHYYLRLDPLNTFTSALSLSLIYGGAAIGMAYLLLAGASGQLRISADDRRDW